MNEPEAASAEWRVRRLIEASNTSRSAHQPLVPANGRQIGTRYIAKHVGSNRHAHADLVLLPKAAEDRLVVDMLRLHAREADVVIGRETGAVLVRSIGLAPRT